MSGVVTKIKAKQRKKGRWAELGQQKKALTVFFLCTIRTLYV
jgi:hypothetical protein